MTRIILYFFLVFNIATTICQTTDDLIIKFYSKTNELRKVIYEKDILCFDWEHQSILLKSKDASFLGVDTSLIRGRMEIILKGQKLYKVDIVSDYSSQKRDSEIATIQFRNKGIFFPYKEWLFIRYIKKTSD